MVALAPIQEQKNYEFVSRGASFRNRSMADHTRLNQRVPIQLGRVEVGVHGWLGLGNSFSGLGSFNVGFGGVSQAEALLQHRGPQHGYQHWIPGAPISFRHRGQAIQQRCAPTDSTGVSRGRGL
jgi:hypothetical protein